MIHYIDLLMKIFNFNAVFIFLYLVLLIASIDNKSSVKDKSEGERSISKKAVSIIAMIIIVCILLYLCLYKKNPYGMLLITILTCIQRGNDAFYSLDVLAKSFKDGNLESFSIKEQVSIMAITCFMLFFSIYGVPTKLIVLFSDIKYDVLSDFLVALSITIFTSIVYFFCCANGFIAISFLFDKINQLLKSKKRCIRFDIVNNIHKCQRNIRNRRMMSTKYLKANTNTPIFIQLIFLLPIYIFDIVIQIMVLVLDFLFTFIEQTMLFCKEILIILKKFVIWLLVRPGKKTIILLFRATLILSMTTVVIVNRYIPLFSDYDKSTAVYEFIASVIVIPLIMSWVIELKD